VIEVSVYNATSTWKGLARSAVLALLVGLWFPASGFAGGAPEYSEAVRRVAEILEQIKANYVQPVDDRKLVADAVNGVLRGLDPHSMYLDAEAFHDMYVDTRGEYGGIGLEVGLNEGRFKVTTVFEDGPAARAGVQPGDVIVAVNGEVVQGWALEQMIRQVRGQRGTPVTLSIARSGDGEPRVVSMTRDIVHSRSASARLIEPAYVYVRVSQFQVNTPENMVRALKRVIDQAAGRAAGIVLDLRDNPGGLLSAAVGVSAAFLPAGSPVVSTDGMPAHSKRQLLAQRETYMRHGASDHLHDAPKELQTLPMVVLVNGASASAAEIVAGALQDNKRATVLGTRTYGKGSVQLIIPFDDGSGVKLTTAYYKTPSGRLIQGKGLTPDVLVEGQRVSETQLAAAGHPIPVDAPVLEAAAQTLPAACAPRGDAASSEWDALAQAPDRTRAASVDCQLEEALHLLRTRLALRRS
jgi:carboxyl-terminal processing protease